MNTDQSRVRAALYVRVSSEEQKQGHNIDSQIAELRQFATQRDWPIVEVYRDEAWSGAALARPALDRLRDDAGKKLFEAVLINDVDRLARDVTHLGIIKRDLERSGVRVVFRKIPSENSPTHNLLVNILGSFAEFEREMILDRTRRGRRHKVETRHQFIGALAPYGYRYLPASPAEPAGKLLLNPEEATVVRMMFNLVDSAAISARDVALTLTSKGLRPRKGGLIWQRSTVLRVLRGSVYTGTWHYNKHKFSPKGTAKSGGRWQTQGASLRLRPREEWIPVALPDSLKIISPAQWKRVQDQLDRNRAFSRRNSKHEYLLSGLVRCGACSGPYCGNPSHGRFDYRCMKRCKGLQQISEEVLNDSVWSALRNVLNDPVMLGKAIAEVRQPIPPDDAAATQLQFALDGLIGEETRILEAYRLSILSPEQLRQELASIAVRRKALEAGRKEMASPKHPTSLLQLSLEEYCKEFARKLTNVTFETKRNVLRLLVRQVTFEGDQVRILGVIPLGGIENTGAWSCGRNPADETMTEAQFTLISKIIRNGQGTSISARRNSERIPS